MRVLFITNTFPPAINAGGAEIASYHTCQELLRRGIDCSILFVNNRMPEAMDTWYTLDSLPVHRINFYTRRQRAITDVFDRRIYRAVRRELRQLKPDLIHVSNVSGATLSPFVAGRTLGVPIVSTLHDLWLLCPNNMMLRADGSLCDPRRGHRQCYRRYDFWGDVPYRRSVFAALTANVRLFISPSQALIDRHAEAGYARRRFRLVRNAVAAHPPAEPRHPGIIQMMSTAHRYQNILYVGGGVEIKGILTLVKAMPLLARHVDRLRMLVAGGGEAPFLEQLGAYAPLVQLLGRVPFDEMQPLYGVSDLTLIPSIWHENSPMVIYQSYQAGVPVAASAIGGIPELIREGETGYLSRAGDAVALAEKIILHFARPADQRRRMRQACLREARTNLTMEQHVDGVLRVYHEALGN